MTRGTLAMRAGLLAGLLLVGTGSAARAIERLDLNTASAQELAQLPGIGPAKAEAIIQHRAQQPFAKADDLRKVKGIGDKLFERIKDQVTVGQNPPAAPKGRGS